MIVFLFSELLIIATIMTFLPASISKTNKSQSAEHHVTHNTPKKPASRLSVNQKKPILLVDDDGYANYEQYFMQALDDIGFEGLYDYWETSTSGTPPLSTLLSYDLVIWECGLGSPNSNERDVLGNYLDLGGSLFIVGQDIGWSIGYTTWYENYLKAYYIADDAGTNNIVGVAGTIFDGASYNLADGDGADNNWYPDVISPLSGAYTIIKYRGGYYNGYAAAIAYDGSYKLVYMAFPFESINLRDDRADAMRRVVIDFFGLTPVTPPKIEIISPEDGGIVSGTTRIRIRFDGNFSQVINVSLRIDDGAWIDITNSFDPVSYTLSYDWNTQLYSDGMHKVTVRVYTADTYDEFIIYVLVDNIRSSILIVNDDPSSSYLDSYVKALENLGLTLHDEFEFWNATLTTPRMLNSFDIVIWYTGDLADPLSSEEQEVITNYLDNGGNLFISSRALGDSLNGTSFYENYIKAILKSHIGNVTDYVFLNDTVEAGVDGWTYNGTWSITSGAYHSPTSCWYSGKYDNDTTIILESSTMDISFYRTAYLSFWTNYSLENQSDFGYIEVSTDGGLTWVTLGSVTGNQTDWVQMTFNITPYISAEFKIRFRLTSNPTISYDGWWIDDIVIEGDALEPIVASSGSIFTGLYWLTGNDSASNALGSDKIENISGAVSFFEYYTGGIAAIGYEGVYKLVYFAFPFESIKNSSSRSYIMRKIIEYLNATGTPTTITTPGSLTVPLFGDVTINIKLESSGTSLGNKEVEFFIKLGDEWVSLGTRKTSSDGTASLSLINVTYPAGTYKVAVVFYGDTTYARSVGFINLNVRKLYTEIEIVGSTRIYDSGGQINIKITDERNKTFVADVMLEVGGMAFQSRTDEDGSASIWVYGVKPGTYKALIRHPGDEYRYANCTKFTLTVDDDDTTGPSITFVSQPTSVEYDEDLIIEANITDESGVYGVTIYYSINNGSQKNVSMTYDAEIGVWRGIIPADDLMYGQVSWFIVAYDADADYKGDSASSQSETIITSVVDNTPPEIHGYSVSPLEPKIGDTIIVRADIYEPEDASGISSVILELKQNNATIATYNMTLRSGLYTAVLEGLPAGEYVCVIIAQDTAGNNATVEFTFKVGGAVKAGIGLVPEILISFALIGVAIILIGIIAYLAARKPKAK